MATFYAIRSVTERAHYVTEVLRQRCPSAQVFVDRERRGCWRLTWEQLFPAGLESGADHIVVMDDDIYPCDHFEAAVAQVLQAEPVYPVSFYANNIELTRIPDGLTVAAWKKGHVSGPCIAYPMPFLRAFLTWCGDTGTENINGPWWDGPYVTGWFRKNRPGVVVTVEVKFRAWSQWDDFRLGAYLVETGTPLVHTNPSLVDHLGFASATKDRPSPQRAKRYIGRRNPLEIDWTAKDYA